MAASEDQVGWEESARPRASRMSATKRYCVVGVSTTASVDAMATVAGGPGMSSLQAYQPPAAATPIATQRSAATLPIGPKSDRAACWNGVETAAGGPQKRLPGFASALGSRSR